jgi:hypothetical protein
MTSIGTQLKHFRVTNDTITAELMDGRSISVPLAWSWRLRGASLEQLNRFEIIGKGEGIHWSKLDEDISIHGMLYGAPARRPKMS